MSITAIILLSIYGAGWLICSLVFGFAFILGMGFNQDNMDTFVSGTIKLFFICLFGIWLWPIAIPIFTWTSHQSDKRIAESNKIYQARIRAGKNYGKRMIIADVPSRLAQYVNTEVTVVRWEVPSNFGMQREVKPVDKWPNGGNHCMVWTAKSMVEVD
jgi:hypothetical protein